MAAPRLKKLGLDQNVLNNYRPDSNLPFLSKLLERIVANQLANFLSRNGLYAKFLSVNLSS